MYLDYFLLLRNNIHYFLKNIIFFIVLWLKVMNFIYFNNLTNKFS